MAKRFFDSRKYQDPWFRKLTPIYKCFWDYLISACSHTGIWKVDMDMAEFCIGGQIDLEIVKEEFSNRIVVLSSEKWFIPKYVDFQYGELNPMAPLHKKIIMDLQQELPKDVFKSIRVATECVQSDSTLNHPVSIGKGIGIDKGIGNKGVVKGGYGEFVKLSTEEHQKLVDNYGISNTKRYIESLNLYAAQKPKKFKEYASHYATIQNWMRKDVVKRVSNEPQTRKDHEKEKPHDPKVAAMIHQTAKGMK